MKNLLQFVAKPCFFCILSVVVCALGGCGSGTLQSADSQHGHGKPTPTPTPGAPSPTPSPTPAPNPNPVPSPTPNPSPTPGLNDFFVSPSGSDSNNGSESAPWATLQHAANSVGAGDTVLVADGTYNQCSGGTIVDITTSGTSSAPVTFQSQNKWGAKLVGDASCEYGFAARASFIVIKDFDISGFGANSAQGIYLASGTNHIVFGNNIHNVGNVYTGSSNGNDCIFVQTNNDLIDSNFMFDCGRTGGHSPSIDHGIYADGASDLTIQNNVIYKTSFGWPIQLYPAAQSNVLIINNTLDGQNSGVVGEIVAGSPLSNSRIANNLFFTPASAAIDFSLGSFSGVTVDHNLTTTGAMNDVAVSGVTFTSNITGASTSGLVLNEPGGDYHLIPGSPAIGAGSSSSAPSTDIQGTPRPQGAGYDIGAYEYPN